MPKLAAKKLARAVAMLAIVSLSTGVVPPLTIDAAQASTRVERAIAAAAGRAAGRAVSHAVSRAVVRDAARYRWPACRAGARELRLRGLRHFIFMRECMRVL